MITQTKIPAGWQRTKLGLLFDFKNGANAEKSSYGKGIKFINVMEIINHQTLTSDFIPGKIMLDEKQLQKNLVQYGDVLFNRTSETPEEIGLTSVYLDTEKVVFGGFVIRARSKNKQLIDKYKKYCFSPPELREEIIRSGQGVVRMNIGQEDLSKIEITLPTLVEQQKIVEVLEAWDNYLEKLRSTIQFKKKVKKWLVQKLLTGRIRLKDFSEPWEILPMGDFFSERKESQYDDLPLLSITANHGVIQQSASNKKDTSNKDKAKYKRICPGDIGYNTMRMWQGRCALSYIEGIVSPAYTIVTPKKTANSKYFSYLFKTPRLAHLFFQKSQGLVSDTWNCKFKDFSKVKYQVPNYEEQTAIANILTTVDRDIETLEKKKSLIEQQKKFLLNNLINGRIRLPEFVKASKY